MDLTWMYQMPWIESEIPTLFADAGEVSLLPRQKYQLFVVFDLKLKNPVSFSKKVGISFGDTFHGETGIMISLFSPPKQECSVGNIQLKVMLYIPKKAQGKPPRATVRADFKRFAKMLNGATLRIM